MSDTEVAAIAGKLETLPAGGFTTEEWLLVIIAIFLLIIVI